MKKCLLLLVASSSLYAAPPVVTPSTPTVGVGGTLTLTADQNVSFVLLGTGTLSGATATSVTYNAPGPGLRANNQAYGVMGSPNNSIWNTNISGLPNLVSSTSYIAHNMWDTPLRFEPDMYINIYDNSTSSQTFAFRYTPFNDGVFKFPLWYVAKFESGLYTSKDQDKDSHLLGVDRHTGIFNEFYKPYATGSEPACLTCNAQSGVKFRNRYEIIQGPTAGGLPITQLLLKRDELRACVDSGGTKRIKHALRITLPIGYLANAHIWPAVAHANDPGEIPFGMALVLTSTVTVTGSQAIQCVVDTLHNEGAYVDDGGIGGHIQIEAAAINDPDLKDALMSEWTGKATLVMQNMVAKDVSPLKETDTHNVLAGTSFVTSTNSYVQPDTQAVLIASNTTTHEWTMVPLIVEPYTMGNDRPHGYNFIAGTPQTQLNVWVRGGTNSGYSCSMTPTLGSLTSDGLYTPPSSGIIMRSSSTVTCTATGDSSVSTSFPVIVYSTDGVRVRMEPNNTDSDYGPDSNGKYWFKERGGESRYQGVANCDFGSETFTPNISLYKYCGYVNSGSGDYTYRAKVPNGNYRITLIFAVGGGATFAPATWMIGLDSKGTIYTGNSATTLSGNGPWTFYGLTGYQIDVCDITGSCAGRVPGTVVLNKTITDGEIDFNVRHLVREPDGTKQALLTAFSIEQTTGTASTTNMGVGGNLNIGGGLRLW